MLNSRSLPKNKYNIRKQERDSIASKRPVKVYGFAEGVRSSSETDEAAAFANRRKIDADSGSTPSSGTHR